MSYCRPEQAPLFAPPVSKTVLRDYQRVAIAAARTAYREGSREILIVAPTGAGKTRIGAELMDKPSREGGGLWLAHTTELVTQARERLLAEGVPRVGVIQAGEEPDPGAPVQVVSVQTAISYLARGRALPPARVVVADEAHHYAADDWGALLRRYMGSTILGLTATPARSDGKPMGKAAGGIFTALVVVAQIKELQALGHLVHVDTVRPNAPQGELAAHPVAAYLEHAAGEMAFCYCTNVVHAEQTALEFIAAGIPAAVIEASTPKALRAAALAGFKSGAIKVLCNVFTLTEGVDVPQASVCIIARGCGSASMYRQMGGRVLRTFPGKTRALVLDLRGACYEHGLLEWDLAYSLEGEAIRRAGGAGAEEPPAIASCKACGAVFEAGPAVCPRCGGKAPPPPAPKVKPSELSTTGRVATMEEKRAAYARFRDVATAKGYSPHWASHRYKALFGVWPKGVRGW